MYVCYFYLQANQYSSIRIAIGLEVSIEFRQPIGRPIRSVYIAI